LSFLLFGLAPLAGERFRPGSPAGRHD